MSYVKVWVHAIWATKKRERLLTKKLRPLVFKHIHENAISKGIYMDCVNGYNDHVHCLFRIRNDQMIHDVLRLLKGESSRWLNKNNLTKGTFAWQKEYLAISVSESQVARVRVYIDQQDSHHHVKSFAEEYTELIDKFGFGLKAKANPI